MQHVRANGVEIAYEKTGSGPPIVLCHGGQSDHRNFADFAPLLAEHFTVIAYDQRDCGETRNGTEPYTAGDLGEDVGALIAALGYERAHVFGESFGGVIAQEAALRCPDRIDRLILCATHPGPGVPVRDDFLKMVVKEKTPDEMREYLRMFFGAAFVRAHPDEADARMQRVVTSFTPEQLMRRGQSSIGFDSTGRLPSLRVPTLVLTGGDDRIVLPGLSERLAALIPGATLVVLEGVGHAMPVEDPAGVVREVCRFILGR